MSTRAFTRMSRNPTHNSHAIRYALYYTRIARVTFPVNLPLVCDKIVLPRARTAVAASLAGDIVSELSGGEHRGSVCR